MIQRSMEIKQLERLYESSENCLALLQGTSRCEKEKLIQVFCKGKPCFYYRGRNASDAKQLALFQAEIEHHYQTLQGESSYDACFSLIREDKADKLVIVIDEFDTIIRKDKSMLESILRLKKGKILDQPLLILLLTSSLTWYEKDMENDFGKGKKDVDAILPLKDLSFLDIVRTLPGYSVREAVQTFGIIGGVPAYLAHWDGRKSVKDNVCRLFLGVDAFFQNEAETYISGELRELAVYDTILSTMAAGREKLNDLFLATGYSRAKISVYLKNLAAFDVVEKVVSFETGGWDHTKKGVYRIKNHFIDFWFHFIYPHLSDYYMMPPGEFYDTYISPGLDQYLKRYFVDVCKEYLELLNKVGKTPIQIQKMGTWVGKQGTIDIVGRNAIRESVVGIANWDEPRMTYARYEQLLEDMKRARIHPNTIYLFSATTFDVDLKTMEAKGDAGIVLVDMTEL